MIEFFKEGGWGMWPILILSLVTVGASARFAAKPQRRQIGFLFAMALATMMSIFHATWTDIGAVFNAAADTERTKDAEVTRLLCEGFKESTRPGAMGGSFLTLAAILGAVGMLRIDRDEE
jgi:Na+/H+ antiporter NhaC